MYDESPIPGLWHVLLLDWGAVFHEPLRCFQSGCAVYRFCFAGVRRYGGGGRHSTHEFDAAIFVSFAVLRRDDDAKLAMRWLSELRCYAGLGRNVGISAVYIHSQTKSIYPTL